MKKLITCFLCLFTLLSGCSFISITDGSPNNSNAHLSENDSTVTLSIYPENDKYNLVEKFDRVEYNHLTELQKSIYIALDNAVFNMQTGYITVEECSRRDLLIAYHALRRDRPEYFWLPLSYSIKSAGNKQEILIAENESDWLCTQLERSQYEQFLFNELQNILSNAPNNASEYERELWLHDYLAKKISYNKSALQDSQSHLHAWSIVGALIDNSAVCEGYAKAMQVLCCLLGIECSVITGTAEEAHMWNIVNIDSQWYHVDLTSNDGDNGIYHLYFNVTDDFIKTNTTIDLSITNSQKSDLDGKQFNLFLPVCNSEKFNYHNVNSCFIKEKKQAKNIITEAIIKAVNSEKNSVEFLASLDMNFRFGSDNAAEFFKLERCISAANYTLSPEKRIYSYSYSGVNDASGFKISW